MEVDQSNKKEKEITTTDLKSSNDVNKSKEKPLNSPQKEKTDSESNQKKTTTSTSTTKVTTEENTAKAKTTTTTTTTTAAATSTIDSSNTKSSSNNNSTKTSTQPSSSTTSKHNEASNKKTSETDSKNSTSNNTVKSSVVSPKTTTTKDVIMTDANDNVKKSIDREKVCPFLIRVFCKKGNHHRIEDFSVARQPTEDEIQIYTWKDASLRELATLLAEVDPKYSQHGSSISFKAIYLDGTRGRFQSKDLGVINISKASKTDTVTLEENRFVIGDFLDVALQTYSDIRRGYSYERSEGGGGSGSSGFGIIRGNGNTGRFGGGGIRNNMGMSFNDRQRKDRIGERREIFSSRNYNNNTRDDRRGNFRSDRLR